VEVEERVYLSDGGPDEYVGRPDAAVLPRIGIAAPQPAASDGDGTASAPAGTMVLTAELPIPDRMHETYLEIRNVASNSVVTVIAVLSPANKRPGAGREEYETKRQRVLGTRTHLVEIDFCVAATRYQRGLWTGLRAGHLPA